MCLILWQETLQCVFAPLLLLLLLNSIFERVLPGLKEGRVACEAGARESAAASQACAAQVDGLLPVFVLHVILCARKAHIGSEEKEGEPEEE